jgi:hypothetical protein
MTWSLSAGGGVAEEEEEPLERSLTCSKDERFNPGGLLMVELGRGDEVSDDLELLADLVELLSGAACSVPVELQYEIML